MRIYLGSFEFADWATSGWTYSDLIDWFGLPDDKSPNQERPQGHGSFPVAASLRSSRAPGFKAQYLGSSPSDVEIAVEAISAIGAEGPVLMRVDSYQGSTWRWVTVASIDPEDWHQLNEATVSIDCISRDPRRYADSSWIRTGPPTSGQGDVWPLGWPLIWPGGGTSGRVMITNSGNAPSTPSFRLGGGFDSATITCVETGDQLGIGRQVPSGAFIEIDGPNRRALYDGNPESDQSRWVLHRQWGDVPAGATRTYQLDTVNPVGSPYLDAKVHSAWW